MNRKYNIGLVIAMMALMTFGTKASTTWNLQGVTYTVDTLYHAKIGPGTTETSLRLTGPVKLNVFYTTTDMTNENVNLKVIMGQDNLLSRVTVPKMPDSHSDKSQLYFAGVNADFFSTNGPIGTTVANNILYKNYKGQGWYAFGVDKNKKLHIGESYASFKVKGTNAGQASVNAVNVPRSDNELILYTSRRGTSTGTDNTGVEVAAIPVNGDLKSSGVTQMKVTKTAVSKVGNMTIPENGFVLSGKGFTTNMLSNIQADEILEFTPTIYFDLVATPDIVEMAGGCPQLLHEGAILNTQGLLDHLVTRQPRTAVGYDGTGTKLVMLVVDGSSTASAGVTSKDLAAMMKTLGCAEALNFDGGGSSTMYVKDLGVLNVPSDGTNRAVKNGLFLSTPATNDTEVASIAFKDYVGKVEKNATYAPIIYAYNAQEVLINTNLKGFALSCESSLGSLRSGNTSVLCNGAGTHLLTATYGNITASIPVTILGTEGVETVGVDSSLNLYPNPVNRGESVNVDGEAIKLIRINNLSGQLIKEINCEGSTQVATDDMVPGIYMATVVAADYTRVFKLILK